jgi:hypothetical protein
MDSISTVWNNVWESIKGTFVSIWESIKSTIKSGIDWIEQQIQRVMNAFNSAKSLVSSVGSSISSGYNTVSSGVTNLFRAGGGPVNPQSPYIVGENGPELFVPQGYGSISKAGSFGGGAIVINITGNSFMGKNGIAEEIGAGLVDILKQNIKIA